MLEDRRQDCVELEDVNVNRGHTCFVELMPFLSVISLQITVVRALTLF